MLQDYPKAIVTPDGISILLRPVVESDEEALRVFFSKIPEREQWFLREKLTDHELLHKWLQRLNFDSIIPIVALREDDGTIIANLRLYRSAAESMRHVAHLRVMVLPEYRHHKIGSWMILDCVKLAMDLGIEKVIAEFINGMEEPAIRAAHRLDFRQEAVLPNYVKDREGKYHDLLIMVRSLQREWSDF
ncbi:MAG: GNAT family N-acetyltransferase [Desulfomonile tiedjei]|uniref:GNAT family N-acetyltransferase n=1 Tax=Desulfomonile tiedjei TaxID=2358 RepID=A0A9D6V4I6_9BACT|nr:GNAT family N-acetyltransferase [Desulfomonile tiedjei]